MKIKVEKMTEPSPNQPEQEAKPSSQYTDLLNMSGDEEVQLANVFCESCGYVSADFVEVGLHLMECEKMNDEENLETYTCSKCKDRTDVVWGHKEKELCRLAKSAYDTIVTFKPNLYAVPANKVGKEFYEMYAETLDWANDESKCHYGWYINHILHPVCLQITDKKSTQKQKTTKLKENIDRIKMGGLKDVIKEAAQTQQKIQKKRRHQEGGRSQTG